MKDAKVMTDHFEGIDKLVKEAPHTDGAPNFRRVSATNEKLFGYLHFTCHLTLNFFKIVYKGDFFRKGGSNSSSACCKRSFEPSTASVCVDSLFTI